MPTEKRGRKDPGRGDISTYVFGRPVGDLPGLHEPVIHERAIPAIQRLEVVDQLDVKRTVLGYAEGRPFITGRRCKVKRGLPKLDAISLDIVSLFDRGGYAISDIIVRYVGSRVGEQAVRDRLRLMVAHGIVEYTEFRITDHVNQGALPRIYRLTTKGWNQVARPQLRTRRTKYAPPQTMTPSALEKVIHHLHALSYAVELLDQLPNVRPFWFTPFWPDGHLNPPRIWDEFTRPNRWRDIQLSDIARPDGLDVFDVDQPTEIRPDATLAIAVRGASGRVYDVPLYVEFDRKNDPAYTLGKYRKWDSARTAWLRHHPRLAALGEHQGAWLHVSSSPRALELAMRVCDQGYTTRAGERIPPLGGAIGIAGYPSRWYYPGRENLLFAVEEDVYKGSLRAFRIPSQPPAVRRQIGRSPEFHYRTVRLVGDLPDIEPKEAGRNWTGLPWTNPIQQRAA
jgi:DNA-binding PadR family transcriptional regulator